MNYKVCFLIPHLFCFLDMFFLRSGQYFNERNEDSKFIRKIRPHWQMQHFDLSLVFNEINKFKSVLLSFNFCAPCGPLSYLWDLGQQLWPSQCRIGSSLRVMYGPSAAIETTVWCTMIYRMFMCTHYNYGKNKQHSYSNVLRQK